MEFFIFTEKLIEQVEQTTQNTASPAASDQGMIPQKDPMLIWIKG